MFNYLGVKISEEFAQEIAEMGLKVPPTNFAGRRILMFVHYGNPLFKRSREQRIQLLKDLQKEWIDQSVTRKSGGPQGTVICIVPLIETEVLRHYKTFRRNPLLYQVLVRWDKKEDKFNSTYESPDILIKAEQSS